MKFHQKILPGQPISYLSLYAILILAALTFWLQSLSTWVQLVTTLLLSIVMVAVLFYRAMNRKNGTAIWFAPAIGMASLLLAFLLYAFSPVDNKNYIAIVSAGYVGYLMLGFFPIVLRQRNFMEILLEIIPLLFVLSAGFLSLFLDSGNVVNNQTTTIWFALITLVLVTLFLPSFLSREVDGKESLIWIAFMFVNLTIGEFTSTFGLSSMRFSVEENIASGFIIAGSMMMAGLVQDAKQVKAASLSTSVSQFYISGATMLSAITVPFIIIFGEYDSDPFYRYLLGYAYFVTIFLVWVYIKLTWHRGNNVNKELTSLLEHEDQTGILNTIGLFNKIFQFRAVHFYVSHISIDRNETSKDVSSDILHPAIANYFMFKFVEPNIVARLTVDDYCIISLDKQRVADVCQYIVDQGIMLKTGETVTVDVMLGIEQCTDYNQFEIDLDRADLHAKRVERTIFPVREAGMDLLTDQENYQQYG